MFFVTNSLEVEKIAEVDRTGMSKFVDSMERQFRAGRRSQDGVILTDSAINGPKHKQQRRELESDSNTAEPDLIEIPAETQNQMQQISTQHKNSNQDYDNKDLKNKNRRTLRSTDYTIGSPDDTPLDYSDFENFRGTLSDKDEEERLAKYGRHMMSQYLYLKYAHIAYFSSFFHIMSTEHDHTFSIYNNKYETRQACLVPSRNDNYDVSLDHCDGSPRQNWIIYSQSLNARSNSTVYLLQNVDTKGCLSINRQGLKLELTSCSGNRGGIVMIPVTSKQYHVNKVLHSNITRQPTVLKELPEHELSLLSDNFVYLIIHGSAVFAIFIIFCSFYYVHTHRKLFQDIIHL